MIGYVSNVSLAKSFMNEGGIILGEGLETRKSCPFQKMSVND